MKEKKLIDEIFYPSDTGKKHILFRHADKIWIMPVKGKKQALEMYQPSTKKGKMLKKAVLWCAGIPVISSVLGISVQRMEFHPEIHKYLQKLLEKEEFYIAAYRGDTSSKQNDKITLQLYQTDKIIAYAKLAKDADVIKTFEHEIKALDFLAQKEIQDIPKIIGETTVGRIRVFVQTTKKKLYQKFPLKFESRHIDCIDHIVKKTRQKLHYEDTDFYVYMQYLKSEIETFDVQDGKVLKEAITMIEKRLNSHSCEYAFAHGDYTASNMYEQKGKIQLFDFEYCRNSMPCYIDVFHYMTQILLSGYRNSFHKVIKLYESRRTMLEQYMNDTDFIYLCYLVYIVSFYAKRTETDVLIMQERYRRRIQLIKYLIQKQK